ncbi:hypothetical protein R1sor_006492 [Riccia sorocarpa]|uniref:Uncharacterized protein n=1 Tax=Riccia sorocarpa TaxID=122646 RepID=A0ABD3HPU2_9MARC
MDGRGRLGSTRTIPGRPGPNPVRLGGKKRVVPGGRRCRRGIRPRASRNGGAILVDERLESSDSEESLERSRSTGETLDSEEDFSVESKEDGHSYREPRMAHVSVEPAMDSGNGESDAEGELTLITKSNVGMFVEDDSLLPHLHDFSEFVGGRKVVMKDTLKSGKVWAGVDVKDEKMLEALPNAAKIWLEITKSNGKDCRQEFSKAFVKLLYIRPCVFAERGLFQEQGAGSLSRALQFCKAQVDRHCRAVEPTETLDGRNQGLGSSVEIIGSSGGRVDFIGSSGLRVD